MADQFQRRPGRPPVVRLTSAQERALDAVAHFLQGHGYPPTARELGDELGVSAASAHELMNELIRKGYLERDPNRARSLRVTRHPRADVGTLVSVPLVGDVAAGTPVLSPENIEGEVLVDSSIVRGHVCFALRVRGDSMRDAGLVDRSIVIVRQQPIAESGEIVVASVDGETTVKRLVIGGEAIELRPENPKSKTIRIAPDADLRIFGKVVGVRQAPED